MSPKFTSMLKLFVTAAVISATAACATVQQAFAPGFVAEAKSAGSASAAGAALVPGSVDLENPDISAGASYGGALVPGSVDLGSVSDLSEPVESLQLVPGSVDLAPPSARTTMQTAAVQFSRETHPLIPR
jgi:hypothetical protein